MTALDIRPLPKIKGFRWKVEKVEDWPHAGQEWHAYILTPWGTRVAYLTVILYHDRVLARHLFVHHAYRHVGLGGKMLRALLDTYADQPIRLNVEPDKDDAPLNAEQLTAWYASMGFVPEDEPPWMTRPGTRTVPD